MNLCSSKKKKIIIKKRTGIYCLIYKENDRKIFTDNIMEAPLSLYKFESVLWWGFLNSTAITHCDTNLPVCCFSLGMSMLIMQIITAILETLNFCWDLTNCGWEVQSHEQHC